MYYARGHRRAWRCLPAGANAHRAEHEPPGKTRAGVCRAWAAVGALKVHGLAAVSAAQRRLVQTAELGMAGWRPRIIVGRVGAAANPPPIGTAAAQAGVMAMQQ